MPADRSPLRAVRRGRRRAARLPDLRHLAEDRRVRVRVERASGRRDAALAVDRRERDGLQLLMAIDADIDVDLLKSEIKKTYASVSAEPEKDFVFPTGRAWAEDLDYPPELANVP